MYSVQTEYVRKARASIFFPSCGFGRALEVAGYGSGHESEPLKGLITRSGLWTLFAFGDVRHVAGGGVKNTPHPLRAASLGGLASRGIQKDL